MKSDKRIRTIALATLVIGNIAVLTGCGLFPSPQSTQPGQTSNGTANNAVSNQSQNNTSGNSTSNNTGSGTNNTALNNASNSTGNATDNTGNSAGQSSSNGGTPSGFTMVNDNGVHALVPIGWKPAPIGGGDWTGSRYVNPKDSNQQVVLVYSSCVGCYLDGSGNPNPKQVIPETGATNIVESSDHSTVTYNVPSQKNPYTGQGRLIVSLNMNGYGYVETYLPQSDSSLSQQILGSFGLS